MEDCAPQIREKLHFLMIDLSFISCFLKKRTEAVLSDNYVSVHFLK